MSTALLEYANKLTRHYRLTAELTSIKQAKYKAKMNSNAEFHISQDRNEDVYFTITCKVKNPQDAEDLHKFIDLVFDVEKSRGTNPAITFGAVDSISQDEGASVGEVDDVSVEELGEKLPDSSLSNSNVFGGL